MTSKFTKQTIPELYDPVKVVLLSLLFSPIFGAQLQALNWARLGEEGEVRNSRLWVRATFWLLLILILTQAVFQNEPMMRYAGIYFLAVSWCFWMITTGYRQLAYVRLHLKKNNFPRAKIGRPVLIGAGCWVIYYMVNVTFGMAMAMLGYDGPEKLVEPEAVVQSAEGVTISKPEGSDTIVVEPLRQTPAEAPKSTDIPQ